LNSPLFNLSEAHRNGASKHRHVGHQREERQKERKKRKICIEMHLRQTGQLAIFRYIMKKRLRVMGALLGRHTIEAKVKKRGGRRGKGSTRAEDGEIEVRILWSALSLWKQQISSYEQKGALQNSGDRSAREKGIVRNRRMHLMGGREATAGKKKRLKKKKKNFWFLGCIGKGKRQYSCFLAKAEGKREKKVRGADREDVEAEKRT